MTDYDQPGELAPGVVTEPVLRTGAGTPVNARLLLTNRAPEPRVLSITALGVDAGWLPPPGRSRPLLPGESIAVDVPLHPSAGTVPARYPLTVAVQALDPVLGRSTAPSTLAEIVLVVDAPGHVNVELAPANVRATRGRRIAVLLSNTGNDPAQVRLEARSAAGARITVPDSPIAVPPGSTVQVPGRVRATHPRLFGPRVRHAYTVTARAGAAPRHVEGSLTARALLGPGGARFLILAAVVAVWVAAALIAIPKLATHEKKKQTAQTFTSTSAAPGPSGSSGAGAGSGGGPGGSGSGAPGGGSGGAGGGSDAGIVRLNGTVAGNAPEGVTVALRPTSLVDEQAEAATPVGISPQSLHARGLVAPSALLTVPAPNRSTVTSGDGAWSFPGVAAPGYYLLTFAKPGFQTQRYVLDASQTQATQPLAVTLAAGQGSVAGTVTGPAGAVGGAQITITDGTNTITTSSNNTGTVGHWSVTGLSTPSTYLVSASKSGLGTESTLVPLGAGASATANLALQAGVGSLVGFVQGTNEQGLQTGLGGVTVTATDGTVTRTATTVTTGPVGDFTLPGLPVPGTYTVTYTAAGYQTQTSTVTFAVGQPQASAGAVLVRASGTVAGTVSALDGGNTEGTGIVLANAEETYKTMTGAGGAFRLSGVAPGSYVLSTNLFGYIASYANVVAVAGKTDTVTLSVRTSPNGGLPASAQVRLQGVMDAITNGPIDCHGTACVRITLSGNGVTTPVASYDPATVGQSGFVAPTATGVAPGLYQATVSAGAGYEPTTVPVQVPVGLATGLTVTATVPTVTLYPVPKLLGTISTPQGAPPAGTCVVAQALDGTDTPCAAVSDTTGGYEMSLPRSGTYQVRVVPPANSEYLPVAPVSVTFGHGEIKQYYATMQRLGRILVSLQTPDPVSGILVPAVGATVTVTPAAPAAPAPTDSSGNSLITRLPVNTYTVNVSYHGQSATSGPVAVTLNSSPAVALTVIEPVNQFVGRLIATSDNSTHGVGGVSVTLTGIVGYSGSAAQTGSVTVTTDANGCFGIRKDPATTVLPVGQCTAAPSGGALAELPLAIQQVSINIPAPANYGPLNLQNQPVDPAALRTITLTPTASDFAGTLTSDPAGAALAGANVVVTAQAAGSGRITVTSDASGSLSWQDSSFGASGQVWPGTYTLSATLQGYAAATTTLSCPLGSACTMGPFVLRQLGSFVLTTVSGRAPGGPVNGASFTLTSPSTTATQLAAPSTNSVTFTGVNPSSTYSVAVQAAGFVFGQATNMVCTGGPGGLRVSPGGTTTCTVTLTPSGAIKGTVAGILAASPATTPTQNLSGVLVTAQACDSDGCTPVAGAQSFTAVTDVTGQFRITGTASAAGLDTGWWQISVSAPGYDDFLAWTQIPATPTADNAVTLSPRVQPITLQVGVLNGASTPVTDATVTITGQEVGSTALPLTAPVSPSTLYTRSAVVPTTYTLQVSGSVAVTNVQIVLVPGSGTTTLYVRTDVNASTISGIVSAVQDTPAATGLAGALVQLGHGTGTSFAVANGVDGNAMSAHTASAGGTNAGFFSVGNIPDGSYVLQVTAAAFVTYETSLAVQHGNAVPSQAITLSRVTQQVSISLTSPEPIAGGTVSLTSCNVPSAPCTPADPSDPLAKNNPPQADQPLTGSSLYNAQFASVPTGTWLVGFTLPSHYGTVTGTTLFTIADNAANGSTKSLTFGLTEGELDLSVPTSPASSAAPATVVLTVTGVAPGVTGPVSPPAFTITTNAGAAVPIYVPAGSYTVTPTVPAGWFGSALTGLTVTGGAPTTAAVTLSQAAAQPVTVTQGGANLPSGTTYSVTAVPQAGQTAPGARSGTTTSTEAGAVTFSGLQPGNWKFTATIGTFSVTSGVVDVPAGQPDTATAVVLDVPAPASETVTVTQAGAPVVTTVTAVPQDGQTAPAAKATAAADGKVTFTGLEPGHWLFRATIAGTTKDTGAQTLTAGATGTSAITFP